MAATVGRFGFLGRPAPDEWQRGRRHDRRADMIEGVLLDLGGVVYVGDQPLPGALEALERLRATGLPLRYITNTTRTPKRGMMDKLRRLGVPAAAREPANLAAAPSIVCIFDNELNISCLTLVQNCPATLWPFSVPYGGLTKTRPFQGSSIVPVLRWLLS